MTVPYVKAQEWRGIEEELGVLRQRVKDLGLEVQRDRDALADKYRVELERAGPGVVWHFFEKPGERWTVQR